MQRVVEPPFEQWGQVLVANCAARAARAERFGAQRFGAIRRALFAVAAEYTAELCGLAEKIGLGCASQVPSCGDPSDAPIVMAGHQPVVYHPGLLEKNLLLSRFVASGEARGVQVVIDTDEGDAGQLVWPQRTADSLTLRSGSIGTGAGLFLAQRVGPANQIAEIFEAACADLRGAGCGGAAERAQRSAAIYQRLAGESLAAANSVVRWTHEQRSYLEVPLSRLLRIPELSNLLEEWVADYRNLAPIYNEVLEAYRREHKIKNTANPFPNMRIEDGAVEVPFWRIEGDSRRVLTMPGAHEHGSTPGSYVAPRGSIVTLALRGFCSDLFIHGRGGAKYDPFVDRFAERYLSVQLPTFVVASATQYLFPERVAQLDRALDLKARYKEIISHTEKFLDGALFTPQEELFLRERAEQRRSLLGELQAASSPADRSAVAHRLNELNRQVKIFVEGSSLQERLVDANQPEVLQARWRFREYPFFFFE